MEGDVATTEPQEQEKVISVDDFWQDRDQVSQAIAHAKFKNARLRLLKARHEHYLAEQREDFGTDEDQTREL